MDPLVMANQASAVKLTGAACLTCLLYNHLITLDQEIIRMWPAKLSLAKILFFLNRYVVESMLIFNCIAASLRHLSPSFCVFFLRWLVVTITVCSAVVQGILVIRVWALYRRNKLAIAVVLFFYLSGIIVLTGLTIHDYVGEDVIINNELDVLPGCYARAVPAIIGGYWITSVGVESVLFIMVISRAYVWWKEGSSAPRILSLLARDSTIYFAVVFALLLANLFVFRFGPPFLSSLLVTPSSTAGCILGSHMLLNLRAMLDPSSDPDFHKSTIATKIIFVPPPRHRESRNRTTTADEGATTVRRGGHGNSTVLAGRRDDEDENDDYDYDDDGWDSYHAKYTSRPTRKWSGNPYLGASGVGGPGYAARRQASGSGLNGGASRSPSSPKPTR